MDWVDSYSDSILTTIDSMDFETLQPFSHLHFQPLFAKEFVDKISELFERTEEQNVSFEELARLFPTGACLRPQIYFTLLDLKISKTPRRKREKIANSYFEMLKALAKDDIYSHKSHILMDDNEVKKLVRNTKFQKANPEIARLLGKLYNALYNLGAGLYFDFYMDYCMENEGPYDVSEFFGPRTILVIKRAISLRPMEIWPDSKDVAVDDIKIYTVYKDVEYRTDGVSTHSVYEGDTINNLIAYAVYIGGKPCTSIEKLNELLENFTEHSFKQWKHLLSLEFETQKQKGLEIKCYGYKNLFERVGRDWKPTKAMINAIKDKPFPKVNEYWKPTSDKEYWKKILDPRIDFYP